MYLVPANAKKSMLIFGFMRPVDLIIGCVGLITTILLLVIVNDTNTLITIVICIPAIVCGLLILPIPNYHNVLVAIQSILTFYDEKSKGNYIWRGWCIYDELKDDK